MSPKLFYQSKLFFSGLSHISVTLFHHLCSMMFFPTCEVILSHFNIEFLFSFLDFLVVLLFPSVVPFPSLPNVG